jgi:Cdc6-like AAA superfamily ATPase
MQLGLFDLIGWAEYTNAQELYEKLQEAPEAAWTTTHERRKNHGQPLFILDTVMKTDFRNHIFHAVENSEVQFRTFDPTEIPRLTAAHAIAEVSSAAGVIVPLINEDIVGWEQNNLRASFILGLCHGFDVEVMAIQYGNGPAALDYREFITNSTYRHETGKHVSEFATKVLVWNQRSNSRSRQLTLSLLGSIDLGSPMAENETQRLNDYFIQTAAFAQAMRAEGAVITGRKGAGKSAIYLQIVESLSRDRQTCIVDLRPASHNLSEMREAILDVVSAGVFDHTIAAFWQYVMYVEILLKLRELALPKARNDFSLQERIRHLETTFDLNDTVVAGDFTSRLQKAVDGVIRNMGHVKNDDDARKKITNTMFETLIPKLREEIILFKEISDEVVILIDDLDKGWPARRVESHDVSMVKHLIEGLNRIQRDLTKRKISVRHLLFLRSDIYEKLVEVTSDRGKYNLIKVDWSDRHQLRNLIRERVVSAVESDKRGDAWNAINPSIQYGDALDYMIDNSLRRPRFLIDICERTISCAMNRGHAFVTFEDIEDGLRQMSLYLVSDFAYEMRDVSGTPETILYAFLGAPNLLSEADIDSILQKNELGVNTSETIDLLLWYGFLGFLGESTRPLFIYDVEYDFRRLEAERSRLNGDLVYVVNSAFTKGLQRAA